MDALLKFKKLKISRLYFLLLLLFAACSDSNSVKEVSGVFEFNIVGEQIINFDAENVTAKITIIGSGGGGGGGASDNSGSSLPGAGGGGAGEVIILNKVEFVSNINYVASIGANGIGGIANSNGGNGEISAIKLDNNILFFAKAGEGGRIDNQNNTGGLGGKGFPNGEKGQDSQGTGAGGEGGIGGDNQSGFGQGGSGGKGEGNSSAASIGIDGLAGYIKIEWTGIK